MLFLENKYTTWYYSIIDKAQHRTINEYVEKHHIIPKTLGGNNDKINLVKLTAREHFICHLLLTKMLEGKERQKMVYALHMLSNAKNIDQQSRYIPSSKLYEYERKIFSEVHSFRMKTNHPLKNPIHKLSHQTGIDGKGPTGGAIKGTKRSDSMKEKMRNRTWTEKALRNRLNNCLESSIRKKGIKNPDHGIKIFENYVHANKNLMFKIWELFDMGHNRRQISLMLKISWDRVNLSINKKEQILNVLNNKELS